MRLLWFCIPAQGHTNPTVEVVRELVSRGHSVRYYSFEAFREIIEDAGAEFVACDGFLPPVTAGQEKRLKRVSTTEMSVQSFRTTARMDAMLAEDVARLKPDLVVTDSACFWGKLTAEKHGLPMVCSTTTFAFNRESSQYLKYSASEIADMIFGLPRLNREMRRLRPLGYRVKSALDIVQNKADTDTIVYTSRRFQPFGDSFDPNHYCFCGPSLRNAPVGQKNGARPLIYIALGTVVNERPDFYRHCMAALADMDADAMIACGRAVDPASLGEPPENVRLEAYADQPEVLSRASLFLTHCGMNSASEGLFMGVPELLLPLTGEERAVARRVEELGAGRLLSPADTGDPKRLQAAMESALADRGLRNAAQAMSEDLRACGGAKVAADFIEAIHARRHGG